MHFLKKHAEGATEGDPDYWYGVVEGCGGTLWHELFHSEADARECVEQLGDCGGQVVILACRILENDDYEYWPLPHRTKEMELAESEQAVEESRKVFEDAMRRHTAAKSNP